MDNLLDKFMEWYEKRHDYAREWKKKNTGKTLAYFCTYVPEEILIAANVLPVRVLGSHEPQNVTEPHIFGMYCPFCRDVLAQGLQGRYDYAEGIAIGQSCLHIRQAYTSWDLHVPHEFSHYINVPHHVQSPTARPFLAKEIENFAQKISDWTGKKLTDADIERGIETMDRNRALMRKIYDIRKDDNPHMTGLEAMYMAVTSHWIDKNEHSDEIERVLEKLPTRELDHDPGARLMVLGSEDDDTEFIRMVESVGATFVVDDHCSGSRYFWNTVPKEGKDVWDRLAQRYIQRPPCPTKDWPERRRIPHIVSLAKDWNVQGVVIIQQKFCDPHEIDIPAIRQSLKDEEIDSLFLEFDVTVPLGQFRSRIEAFLELLLQEDLL
ncbi:MAG: benzoyl-CoA reductase, bzd-type, subunit N [Planctomycetota bacterium]|jgi:benzoyl-CoA reductase subunit C